MGVSIDKLPLFVAKSMVDFLRGSLTIGAGGFSGVWLLSPEFRHERAGSGAERALPYVGVRWLTDEDVPMYVGPDAARMRTIYFELMVFCGSIEELLTLPGQVRQAVLSNDVTLDPGPPVLRLPSAIPLLDYDSGSPAPTVGPIEVILGEIRPLIDEVDQTSNDKGSRRRLEHAALIDWRVELEKIRTAKLLT